MAHTVNKIRRFGSVGRLSSGRWRARFSLPDGSRLSAPDTFDSKVEAENWLTLTWADMLRGAWRVPTQVMTLAKYMRVLLDSRLHEIRRYTMRLYDYLSANYITVPVRDRS